ncbi:MAG: helicase, partial [Dehalococcoidia bacterium]|nr:helicase [Dehalococcoidia bacterium]
MSERNAMAMSVANRWTPGSLVSARDRMWVVIPSEDEGVTLLRPVDGSEEDAIGIFDRLEPDTITEATYPYPEPDKSGDFRGALLLRDAVRLTLRAGAGPFRCIGRLSVVPRPYQYVPLIMALRMNPVRLLIADDVGVGKTIEAAMIARELLDRGIVRRV